MDDYRITHAAAARKWSAFLEVGCLAALGGIIGSAIAGTVSTFWANGNVFAALVAGPLFGGIGFLIGFYVTLKLIARN